MSVVWVERTNSGIQFDHCETVQRNVFIASEKTLPLLQTQHILHVDPASRKQAVVCLHLAEVPRVEPAWRCTLRDGLLIFPKRSVESVEHAEVFVQS